MLPRRLAAIFFSLLLLGACAPAPPPQAAEPSPWLMKIEPVSDGLLELVEKARVENDEPEPPLGSQQLPSFIKPYYAAMLNVEAGLSSISNGRRRASPPAISISAAMPPSC